MVVQQPSFPPKMWNSIQSTSEMTVVEVVVLVFPVVVSSVWCDLLVWCAVVGPDVCNCEARHDPRWQECNCEPPHQLSKGGHRHTSTGDWDIVLINCMLSGGRPTDDRIGILFLGKGWNV